MKSLHIYSRERALAHNSLQRYIFFLIYANFTPILLFPFSKMQKYVSKNTHFQYFVLHSIVKSDIFASIFQNQVFFDILWHSFCKSFDKTIY